MANEERLRLLYHGTEINGVHSIDDRSGEAYFSKKENGKFQHGASTGVHHDVYESKGNLMRNHPAHPL
ncbi:hypothetical protein P5673_009936 [Acropora cervicornis]|uniref:Uncharacterized protein n=1 Tax=Acropora cervicornis TaxID=6130 RepID=A0AAD9QSA2_ACRCE|nr:hypothetical protein P5673_009936 [Acropora cervicornis]